MEIFIGILQLLEIAEDEESCDPKVFFSQFLFCFLSSISSLTVKLPPSSLFHQMIIPTFRRSRFFTLLQLSTVTSSVS